MMRSKYIVEGMEIRQVRKPCSNCVGRIADRTDIRNVILENETLRHSRSVDAVVIRGLREDLRKGTPKVTKVMMPVPETTGLVTVLEILDVHVGADGNYYVTVTK